MFYEEDIFWKKRYCYWIDGFNEELIELYDLELVICLLLVGNYCI